MKNKSPETEKIWLSPPHLSGSELKYIEQAFAENWVTTAGNNITEFEKELCQVTGAKFAVALNSGTAAIHLGLILLGIRENDEVICPTFTFAATANPILYQKAIPIFIDSEPETWNICPILTQKAILEGIEKGKKPKALVVVHLYGQPARMPEFIEIAQEFDIPILEDAAEALGSSSPPGPPDGGGVGSASHKDGFSIFNSNPSFGDKVIGTMGEMSFSLAKPVLLPSGGARGGLLSVLSFNGNKIITTSGGGALLTDDENLAKKALYLATQAREPFPYYQHSEVGYNYRMSNISAGIGRGQMEVLEERILQKRRIFEFYKNAFADIPEISFQPEPEGYFSNRWLTAILIDPKSGISSEKIRLALADNNIEARPLWKPLHLQPVFQHFPFYTENSLAERLFEQGLCLPSGTQLTENQLSNISGIIKSYL